MDDDSDQSIVSDVDEDIFRGPSVREAKQTAPQLLDCRGLNADCWRRFLAREDFLASSLAEIRDHVINREFDFSNSLVLHPLAPAGYVAMLTHQQAYLNETASHILVCLRRLSLLISELNRTASHNFAAVKVSLKLALSSCTNPYDRSRAVLAGITAAKHCLAQCTESIDSETVRNLVDETVELLYDYNQAVEHHSSSAQRAGSIAVAQASVQLESWQTLQQTTAAIETMVGEGATFVSDECCYMATLVAEVQRMFDDYVVKFRRFAALSDEYDMFGYEGKVM